MRNSYFQVYENEPGESYVVFGQSEGFSANLNLSPWNRKFAEQAPGWYANRKGVPSARPPVALTSRAGIAGGAVHDNVLNHVAEETHGLFIFAGKLGELCRRLARHRLGKFAERFLVLALSEAFPPFGGCFP